MRLALLSQALFLFFSSGCMDQAEDTTLLDQGRTAFSERRYVEAESSYEQYLRQQPQGGHRYEAWSRLLDVARNIRDDKPKAASILDAMYLEFGEDPAMAWKILPRLAQVYESMRQWDKASDTWNKTLVLPAPGPITTAEIHRRLGRVYQQQSQYDLALEAQEACLQHADNDKDKAACLYDQGLTLSFLQSFDRAAEALNQIQSLPQAPPQTKAKAQFLLAELLEEQGKIQEAITLFTQILPSYPNPQAVQKRLEYLKKQ